MVKELPGYPVQNSPSGSFFSWGGAVGREGIVYGIVWMGCPRRRPWTKLRTPVRILSTSFSSVSIFSVCWYSRVSISMGNPHVGGKDGESPQSPATGSTSGSQTTPPSNAGARESGDGVLDRKARKSWLNLTTMNNNRKIWNTKLKSSEILKGLSHELDWAFDDING